MHQQYRKYSPTNNFQLHKNTFVKLTCTWYELVLIGKLHDDIHLVVFAQGWTDYLATPRIHQGPGLKFESLTI